MIVPQTPMMTKKQVELMGIVNSIFLSQEDKLEMIRNDQSLLKEMDWLKQEIKDSIDYVNSLKEPSNV